MKRYWWIIILLLVYIAFVIALVWYLSAKRSSSSKLPAGTIKSTVVSWQPITGIVTVKIKGKTSDIQLTPPVTVIIIPVNSPDKPKDERLVMTKTSSWWRTAFCPQDTVEISNNGKKIRNEGPRTCK